MKSILCAVALCFSATVSMAQGADPVIMKINGEPVYRSEFVYSYGKNNTEGVIDKKSVEEYKDLFINYKLKVCAAIDAKYDTLTSYQKEFRMYRDQQIRPSLINDADIEAEAVKIYDNTKNSIGPQGLVRPRHILVGLRQTDSQAAQDSAKQKIDSIYTAIKAGADFGSMARKYSTDFNSAREGGLLPWISINQTFKEFETVAFGLQPGEMSEPFLSPVGYHIVLMDGRKQLEPYDSLRAEIMQFIEQRNLREHIIDKKIDDIVKASDGKLTAEQLMDSRADSLQAIDTELKNLIREYHDGLLLYEISNELVWDKAAKDEKAQEQYFKKNKKQYVWDEPRFKGMAYHVKEQADVKAVADCVKKLKFGDWAEALRSTFNADSVIRIRVEKGIFKKGDNALVDREQFGVADAQVKETKGYPIDATYGTMLKKPEDYTDVKGQVIADLQAEMMKLWEAELRKKYTVEVFEDVLKTVQ